MLTSSALAQSSWPTVYYNPDTGDDSNSGTQAKPVKTLEKAKSILTGPGQIISPLGVTSYMSNNRKVPKPLQGK